VVGKVMLLPNPRRIVCSNCRSMAPV